MSRKFVISEIFFKSIAEKGKLYSRVWFYWLSEEIDNLFELDFVEKQVEKFHTISEIREIYEFGIQLLRQDFKIINEKSKKPLTPINKVQKKIAEEIISYLNNSAGTSYSLKGTNIDLIVCRMKEGYLIDDFKKVIDKKVSDWKGTDWEKYLRPLTLFQKGKFENYLNQKNEQSSSQFEKFTNSILKASQQLNKIRNDQGGDTNNSSR